MNAASMNLPPVNASPNSPAGKQQDSTTAETPFNQILSSEMAQSRRADPAAEDSAGAAVPPLDATAQNARPADAVQLDAAQLVAETTQAAADALALPLVDTPVAMAHPLLALGIPADPLQPAAEDGAHAEGARILAALGALSKEARTDTAVPAAQAGRVEQPEDAPHTLAKTDPTLPTGKADPQADKAAATAFAAQLATARQADAVKTREFVSELANTPALRPAEQAPLASLPGAGEAAAPRLNPPVGTAAWSQALGEKIVWMAAGAQQSATLTLNPPNLGPLQVVLNVSNEQATASFFSAQPEVRQALEAAFPRLREMMNEAGIQLGQATVSADTPQQQNPAPDRQAPRVAAAFPGADEPPAAGEQAILLPPRHAGRGLVDTFA